MFEQLNEKLVRMKENLIKKQKWDKQMVAYQKEQMELEKDIYYLKDKLKEEVADVEKLEGISITKLFFTILGTKEEKLNKEKQEVVTVQLKLEEIMKTKSNAEQAMKELQGKLLELGNVERDYHDMMDAKERLIMESPYAERLYHLGEQEGEIKAYLTELAEAIIAGNAVTSSLSNAAESLESADSWGTFDMLGGGMLTDMVKHDHIDDAKDYIHHAQSKMRIFQKELIDIHEELEIQIEISGLLKFADFFFDGLIADWMVQGKIEKSLEETENKKEQVEEILSKLKIKQKQKQQELVNIQHVRENLIETI